MPGNTTAKPQGLWRRLREFFWPSMGPKRYAAYLARRTQRLRASPHAVAAGVASGAAVSIFPFVGFHFLLGFVLAFFTRGSMLAAAIGTAVGNPITFPFIFAATYNLGRLILPGEQRDADAMLADTEMTELMGGMFTDGLAGVWPVMQAMIIGAIPLSIITYLAIYTVVRLLVSRSRARRAVRLAAKRAAQSSEPADLTG
jgi:uncharacterized protein (DUF2062 family)